MSRLNLCPPRRKRTPKTDLPSWGQIKKLTSQATSLIRRLISTQSYSCHPLLLVPFGGLKQFCILSNALSASNERIIWFLVFLLLI
ncbi:unnamed protein product [Nyctereutes procyonoides]|uniref:(raccoon dog) hypothetical protein n=1 Tax=Nyctereutes procyonoides TaxID=34880 RepID=A0A811Z0W5_NYCPR|nr:unnamed protein product [Nyctereutes procyonoides]